MPRWLYCWKHIWLTPWWEEMGLNKVPGPMEGRPQPWSMKSAKLLRRRPDGAWGWGHVWWTGRPEGRHVLDTGGLLRGFCRWLSRASLVRCWQALPPDPPWATRLRLAGFLPQSSLAICSVPSLGLEEVGGQWFTACEAVAGKTGLMPHFWEMMKKFKKSSSV